MPDYGELSDYGVEGLSLEDALEEMGLPDTLTTDDEVIKAHESGLVHYYITQKIDGALDTEIIEETSITQEQCEEWGILHDRTISLARLQVTTEQRDKAQDKTNPLHAGINNITAQDGSLQNNVMERATANEITAMVKKMQSGDTTDMLTILATQAVQLQMLNNKITQTASNTNRFDIMQKFQNLQLKTINETRKTVMAMNEICNPKRTTFIKTATQNNLSLENSNKNDIKNELPAPSEDMIDAETYTSTTTRV